MKKSTLIGISILSVFILCSLSYQPIIADNTFTLTSINENFCESNICNVENDELQLLSVIGGVMIIRSEKKFLTGFGAFVSYPGNDRFFHFFNIEYEGELVTYHQGFFLSYAVYDPVDN